MDETKRVELLDKVNRQAKAHLLSIGQHSARSSTYDDAYDQFLRELILEFIRQFHAQLLPFSIPLSQGNDLMFLDTRYTLVASRAWNREVLEIAFQASATDERLDAAFPVDLAIQHCEYTKMVRLFPPRADIMFEFQQGTLRDVVEAVLMVGEEYVRSAG